MQSNDNTIFTHMDIVRNLKFLSVSSLGLYHLHLCFELDANVHNYSNLLLPVVEETSKE